MAAPQLTRMHRVLIGVVVTGAVIIAGIGFAGSYAAVRALAVKKGFGDFSYVFPIGIDAGICVLLALDLLLTWIRIPFPLLRQTAWLLTLATIAFNGAAAWPDPLGVGMHAVIPVLFVVAVEAARHAIGRIADITADKHMEGVRLTRWLLSPIPTFLLWRRMKLWELRSYDQVIRLEQDRLVYQARLRSRFGRYWRRKAPVEALTPLRLARYGIPLAETGPQGLTAAGIEPPVFREAAHRQQQAELREQSRRSELGHGEYGERGEYAGQTEHADEAAPADRSPRRPGAQVRTPRPQHSEPGEPSEQPQDQPQLDVNPWLAAHDPQQIVYEGGYDASYVPEQTYPPDQYNDAWQFQDQHPQVPARDAEFEADPAARAIPSSEDTGTFPIPAGPGRTRQLGEGVTIPGPREEQAPFPEGMSREDEYYHLYRRAAKEQGMSPTLRELSEIIQASHGVSLSDSTLRRYVSRFQNRLNSELAEEHIA